jgi:hypothetical protein
MMGYLQIGGNISKLFLFFTMESAGKPYLAGGAS